MSGHSVFVYGTLLEAERQSSLLGRVCATAPASIKGYRRCFGKWPYLVPDTNGVVSGAVIASLSDDDLVALDAYEDLDLDPKQGLYERLRLDARLENGHIVSVWVYMPILENWDVAWQEGNT